MLFQFLNRADTRHQKCVDTWYQKCHKVRIVSEVTNLYMMNRVKAWIQECHYVHTGIDVHHK